MHPKFTIRTSCIIQRMDIRHSSASCTVITVFSDDSLNGMCSQHSNRSQSLCYFTIKQKRKFRTCITLIEYVFGWTNEQLLLQQWRLAIQVMIQDGLYSVTCESARVCRCRYVNASVYFWNDSRSVALRLNDGSDAAGGRVGKEKQRKLLHVYGTGDTHVRQTVK